jgi:hypothetical protein
MDCEYYQPGLPPDQRQLAHPVLGVPEIQSLPQSRPESLSGIAAKGRRPGSLGFERPDVKRSGCPDLREQSSVR